MDRATRKDLLETIEKQKDQVSRYEKRLRDVIGAYKSLVKEKEALEASLQILSQPPAQQSKDDEERQSEDGDSEKRETADQGEKFDDPLSVNAQGSNSNADETTILQLKSQLATLTNALATVTAEKTRMEQSFQADKKKILQEQEDSNKHHTEERQTYEDQLVRLQEQLSEAKSKLRAQQLDLEQEHTSHAMILHELQQLVTSERTEKDKLELKVEELQDALHRQKSVPNKTEEYERRITTMSDELEAVRRRLKASEDLASRPPPLLLELQREMAEMKAQHRIQVQSEQRKAVEAEEKLRQVAESDERRVSGLEEKLSELSEVVGNYERLRYQDQLAIQRLKERVTQLDLENTALARVANKTPVPDISDGEDSNLDVNTLLEKITKMKGLLKLANQRAEKPVDIDEVCNVDDCTSLESDPAHRACQQELKQLKDEFERYKLRAQNVLKSKNAKDNTSSKEMESLKSQVTELRDRVSTLRQHLDDQDRQHEETIGNMVSERKGLEEHHREELAIAEAEYKHKVGELEEQVHRQRDRTLALIEEKDREIEVMKQKLQQTYGAYGGDYQLGSRHSAPDLTHTSSGSADDIHPSDSEPSITELLSQTHLNATQGGDTAILHHIDVQARKDVEINTLRKQKHQLETALRQLQDKCVTSEQKFHEELEKLGDEVNRLERSQSRESANLEYLKNVIYNYMMSDDYTGKLRMLNAIMTILHFSPKERDKINIKKNASWSAYFNKTATK